MHQSTVPFKIEYIGKNHAFFCLILLVLVFSLAGCRDKFCEVTNSQKGIILRTVDFGGDCLALDTLTQYVINSESEWKQLAGNACTLSNIDFNTETVIGMRTTGACEVGYAREVTRVDSEKIYHYRVITTTCGHCERMEINFNLVVVPKLPVGYSVTFENQTNP